MRKSTRLFLVLLLVEVLLVAGAAYMINQVTSGAWRTFDQADALQRIYTVMGAAIGGIGGCFLFLAAFLRFKGQ